MMNALLLLRGVVAVQGRTRFGSLGAIERLQASVDSVVSEAIAAAQHTPNRTRDASHQRAHTRSFADVVARDVTEHLRTRPKLSNRLDQIRDSDANASARFRAALPIVTTAAQSLFKIAGSGAVDFKDLFPKTVLENITRNVLNKV